LHEYVAAALLWRVKLAADIYLLLANVLLSFIVQYTFLFDNNFAIQNSIVSFFKLPPAVYLYSLLNSFVNWEIAKANYKLPYIWVIRCIVPKRKKFYSCDFCSAWQSSIKLGSALAYRKNSTAYGGK